LLKISSSCPKIQQLFQIAKVARKIKDAPSSKRCQKVAEQLVAEAPTKLKVLQELHIPANLLVHFVSSPLMQVVKSATYYPFKEFAGFFCTKNFLEIFKKTPRSDF